MANRKHILRENQWDSSDHNGRLFISPCNNCKRVLKVAYYLFVGRMRHCTHFNKFDYRDYWWLCNSMLHTLLNFSTYKANALFVNYLQIRVLTQIECICLIVHLNLCDF